MIFILLASHAADKCPLANATTRHLILETAPKFPQLAQSADVQLVAGPYVNREHTVVVVMRSKKAENVDRFLHESRLDQWNTIRVIPSLTLEAGLLEIEASTPIF
ncbi:hypothetical protein [Streptomyces sp. NPDC048340]|uniref:hypothetical protein n=1 Tax=Streptomyces sp. NPDC048340 TaxID=3365537 RepID=UPI0037180DD6